MVSRKVVVVTAVVTTLLVLLSLCHVEARALKRNNVNSVRKARRAEIEAEVEAETIGAEEDEDDATVTRNKRHHHYDEEYEDDDEGDYDAMEEDYYEDDGDDDEEYDDDDDDYDDEYDEDDDEEYHDDDGDDDYDEYDDGGDNDDEGHGESAGEQVRFLSDIIKGKGTEKVAKKTGGRKGKAKGRSLGLLGGVGDLLGGVGNLVGGILGGHREKVVTTVTHPKAMPKLPQPQLQHADISQKALATSFMQAALKAKEKMLGHLPAGTELEEPPPPPGGLSLQDMEMGTLAMLENGDMMHKFPAGHEGPEYVYLPSSGGIILLTEAQIRAQYEEPVKAQVQTVYQYKHTGGLLPAVGDLVGGLLFGRGMGEGGGGGGGEGGGHGGGHHHHKGHHKSKGHHRHHGGHRHHHHRARRSLYVFPSSGTESNNENDEANRKEKRGWLTGNASQGGNGCHGIFGLVGWILGNKKGCGEAEDSVTIVGANGGTIMPPGVGSDGGGYPGYPPPPQGYPPQGYPPQGYPPQGYPPQYPPPEQRR